MKASRAYETREIANDIGEFYKRQGHGDFKLVVVPGGWAVASVAKIAKPKIKKPGRIITLRKKKAVT